MADQVGDGNAEHKKFFPVVDWAAKELYIQEQRFKTDLFLSSSISVKRFFDDTDLTVEVIWELPNQYWPPAYQELRAIYPWWLVKTKFGLITIGWRKRVISIDWKHTKLRMEVTKDDVTKGTYYVHVHDKMFEYLRTLSNLLNEYKTS